MTRSAAFALAPLWVLPISVAALSRQPIELFNGTDLTGWIWFSDQRLPRATDAWTVVDGNLRCDGAPKGYIRTKDDYTSFVLTMQLRPLKPALCSAT
jgi:hypothetical protein